MGHETWIPVEALGITEEQAQEWAEARKGKARWQHFTPEFVGTHAQEFDFKLATEHLDTAQRIYQEGRINQPEGIVMFQNDLPVTIFTLGDIHLGSIYTDHQRLYDDLKRISDTPNAYIVLMSNLIDNAIPAQYPHNMMANALTPDKQVMAMRKICEELNGRGKVLGAVTSPCHEGWTYTHTGQDINALIHGFPERKYPVLENGGRLVLDFPIKGTDGLHWRVTMGLYHMVGPFESNFSPTHSTKQMNRLRQNMECDIVVAAHKHVGDAETVFQGTSGQRKVVCYIRSGCYKGIGEIHDRWSIDKYGVTGDPSGESVTIIPSKKLMDSHLLFEVGILAQESYLAHQFA